ncbi:MAG: hypothetical protein AB7V14_11870 [Kiritimatiellia bacterium]
MNVRSALAFLPALLLLAGCATPERRIEQNRDLFDSLPVADQARIRGGKIDLGYTPDMVRIAFGEPSASWSAAPPSATPKSGCTSASTAASTASAPTSTA